MMRKLLCIIGIALGLGLCLNAQNTASKDLDSQYATKLLQKGRRAPDFIILDREGNTVRLSDYKGKYVVLDFWASWCRDCRKDLPHIKQAHEKYGSENVVFIGVSFDDDREKWESAIEEFDLNYLHVSELKKWRSTTISPLYKIDWIPTIYVIDPTGRVLLSTVMVEKLDKTLETIQKK